MKQKVAADDFDLPLVRFFIVLRAGLFPACRHRVKRFIGTQSGRFACPANLCEKAAPDLDRTDLRCLRGNRFVACDHRPGNDRFWIGDLRRW